MPPIRPEQLFVAVAGGYRWLFVFMHGNPSGFAMMMKNKC